MKNCDILIVLLLLSLKSCNPIRCYIGYGQRSRLNDNGIVWERNCHNTNYCIEVITTNYTTIVKLIDYYWNSYYSEYYIKYCGGEYGSSVDYHPYRNVDKKYRKNPNLIKVNVTIPYDIKGLGGNAQMKLNYVCRKDLCTTGESNNIKYSHISIIILIMISSLYLII